MSPHRRHLGRLAAERHWVIVDTVTTGGKGECPEGSVATQDVQTRVRRQELFGEAETLWVVEVYLLGYRGSGMTVTPANQQKDAFCNVDQSEAAVRLAKILEKESIDASTIYGLSGGCGHPDHV